MAVAICLIAIGIFMAIITMVGILPVAIVEDSPIWYFNLISCLVCAVLCILGGARMVDKINAEKEQNTCEVMEEG